MEHENLKEEKNDMPYDNYGGGNVGPSDIATLSLLGGYGGYGRGGGGGHYTGNSVLAAQAHADGTAVGVGVNRNADLIRDQASAFENGERSRQFAATQMQTSNGEARLAAQISGIEINALRQQADTLAAINTNAKDAAECCCDAKLEAQKNTSMLLSEMTAIESRRVRDDLDQCRNQAASLQSTQALMAANSQNTAAIIAAINSDNGGHHGGH